MGKWDRQVTSNFAEVHASPTGSLRLPPVSPSLGSLLWNPHYVTQDSLGCKWQKPNSNRQKQKWVNILVLERENPRVSGFRHGWILGLKCYHHCWILSISLPLPHSSPTHSSLESAVLCVALKLHVSHVIPWDFHDTSLSLSSLKRKRLPLS